MCFSIFPMGKKYMEREGNEYFSLSFHILFFPFFPMGKNGKTHLFPWAKMGLDPPPPIYRFGIEKACVTTRNYIPCAIVISTTLTLLSVCSVTIIACAIHITAHFTAHEAQILIFWRMCSTFFVIKKG